MKKRNPVAVAVLSLVTLGIYELVWFVKTKKELNAKNNTKVPTIWLLFGPSLAFIFAFILAKLLHSPLVAIILYVVALLAFTPLSFYWFFKYSKAVNEYTDGKMSTAVSFLLLWLVNIIGIALIQDAFNGVAPTADTYVAQPPVPQSPTADNNSGVPASSIPLDPMQNQVPTNQPIVQPQALNYAPGPSPVQSPESIEPKISPTSQPTLSSVEPEPIPQPIEQPAPWQPTNQPPLNPESVPPPTDQEQQPPQSPEQTP